ncbi:MAG: carbamoyl phosphate synthase large subunit, partial [Bacteroidales bacterium]|nr:carbamoyl phosphate synthase large subunit [Bacteroidales bacterium]
KQKAEMLTASKLLIDKGYNIFATSGTYRYFIENNIPATRVLWPDETGSERSALEMIHNKEIDLVVNIPKNLTQSELDNGYKIRRAAVDFNIPLITNTRLATAFIISFCNLPIDEIQIKSWDEYTS